MKKQSVNFLKDEKSYLCTVEQIKRKEQQEGRVLRQGERENMNLNYIIGLVGAALVCIFGMVTSVKLGAAPPITINFANLINFFDPASILIVIGCTIFIVVASFPGKMLKAMPKHFKIILNNKLYDPGKYIDQLVDLAQIARKNGLLALARRKQDRADRQD